MYGYTVSFLSILRLSPLSLTPTAIKPNSHTPQHIQHREVGKRKTIVIIAEGAIDTKLNAIKPDHVKTVLHDRLGLDTRVTTLGHTQRGGKPCAYDRILVSFSVYYFTMYSPKEFVFDD